ncbi:MAG TPA: rhodanese-like domain-containing protein, partial [Anaerolineales bacterium]
CNALLPQTTEPTFAQTQLPTQILIPTQITEPVSTEAVPTQPQPSLPQTDAEVPRVPVDQAKAAFDSGKAVIVDVRGPGPYGVSHIAGALEISLSEIQDHPTDLKLDKDQWIITYCT